MVDIKKHSDGPAKDGRQRRVAGERTAPPLGGGASPAPRPEKATRVAWPS